MANSGDNSNVLLRKILTTLAAASTAVLATNQPKPGDSDNNLLRKILALLVAGGGEGTTSGTGGGSSVSAGTGAPATTAGAASGDVYVNITNGDTYVYNSTTLTWTQQNFTVGNNFSAGAVAPSNGNGKNGDYYLNLSTYEVFLKAGDVWNLVGDVGNAFSIGAGVPNNANGKLGDYYLDSTTGLFWARLDPDDLSWSLVSCYLGNFSSGAGVPNNANGKNGDYYLNTTNNTLYLKTAGVWASLNYFGNFSSGAGAPAGGKDGDYYLNLTTKLLSVKTSGTWGDAGVLTSPENSYASSPGGGWAMDIFNNYAVGASPTISAGIGWSGNGVLNGTSAIVNETAGNGGGLGLTENLLTLNGPGEFGRKFAWGNNWNRIRIGVLLRIDNNATFNGEMAIGVCSGTTNMFSSTNCTNFFGLTTLPGNSNAFTRTAASGVTPWHPYFLASFFALSYRQVNTTTNVGQLAGASNKRIYAETDGYLAPLLVDIYRPAARTTNDTWNIVSGTVDLSAGAWFNNGDYSFESMKWMVMGGSANSMSGVSGVDFGQGTSNVAYSENAGVMDTLNIYWSHATIKMVIRAVAVWRVC